MKKLLTICLLLATFFSATAQEKPSKDTTIAFIKRSLESTKGTQRNGGMIILEYDFDLKSIYIKGQNVMFPDIFKYEKYSVINWDKLSFVGEHTVRNKIVGIVLVFETPVKYENEKPNGKAIVEYQNEIRLEIPEGKFESLKKAFLRLAEIDKEENKDPFQN